MSVCTDKERLEAELVQLRNREQSLSTNDALEKVVDSFLISLYSETCLKQPYHKPV